MKTPKKTTTDADDLLVLNLFGDIEYANNGALDLIDTLNRVLLGQINPEPEAIHVYMTSHGGMFILAKVIINRITECNRMGIPVYVHAIGACSSCAMDILVSAKNENHKTRIIEKDCVLWQHELRKEFTVTGSLDCEDENSRYKIDTRYREELYLRSANKGTSTSKIKALFTDAMHNLSLIHI